MSKSHAGGTVEPGGSSAPAALNAELVAYDQYIDAQLHTARRQVRVVDIAIGLTTLAAGTIGYFILAALVDHWVVPGGLSAPGRWLALSIYLAGALYYLWRFLLPLCLHRINPVYAAEAIERSKPSLKNSLINFLLLRRRTDELAPSVFAAIEERAATELAQVPVEASIDRSQLIKIGYVFLGLLAIAAIYKVASPKDPVKTVGRIMAPWADIAPPTRVTIVAVRPGNSTVMRGQQAKIAAEIRGLGRSQSVKLVYSTADGQIANRSLAMRSPSDGYFFECDLPEGKGGIQQDVAYRVVAGDAASNDFQLSVQAAPTIVIESVDYAYPSYTGMVAQTVDHQGDLRAIEGTRVTLHALANQPIKAAYVDLDCNGTDDVRMDFDGLKATATITLALKPDRATPEHASYQLRFTDTQGQDNLQPIRHQIEVTRDVAPEIDFVAPKRDEVEVPLNVPLASEISAHDPDFALARVSFVGRGESTPLFERPMFDAAKAGQPWQGQLRKKLSLSPKRLGLKVGDVLEYWAWAEDNKSPEANRTETAHRRARIVAPTQAEPSPDAMADNNPDSSDDEGEQGQAGESKAPNQPESKDGKENSDGHPGQPPAGKDQNRAQGKNPNEQPPGDKDQQPQPGEQGQGEKMTDRGGERDRQDGEQERQPGKQEKEQDRGAGEQAGADQGGGGQGGQEQAGNESGQGKSGQGKSGQGQSGKDQSGAGSQQTGNDSEKNGAGQGRSGQEKQGREGQGGNSAGQSGSRSTGKQGSGRSESREPVAQDGTEDGEAFNKIMRRQGEQDGRGSQSAGKGGERDRGQPGEHDKSAAKDKAAQGKGSQRDDEKKPGEQSSADEKMDGQHDGEKGSGEKKTENDKRGQPSGEKSAGGNDKSGQPQAGGESTEGQSGTGKPTAEKKPGAGKSGGENDAGQGQPSEEEKPAADGAGKNGQGKNASGKDGMEKKPGEGAGGDGEKRQPGEKSATEKQPGATGPGGKQPGEKKAGEKQPGGSQGDEKQEDGAETDGAGGEKPAGGNKPEKKPGEKKGAGQGSEQGDKDHPEQPESADGAGSKGTPDEKRMQNKQGQGTGEERKQPAGGEQDKNQGQSGGGQPNDDRQNTTTPQGQNKGRDKAPGKTPPGKTSKPGEPPAQSQSEYHSDSQSDSQGDRSGGGKSGGGQQSKQPGQGNPGSQSEAEEGGEAMPDKDGPETSDQSGDDRVGDKSTGKPGEKTGQQGSSGTKSGKGSEGSGSASGKSGESGANDERGEKTTGSPQGEGRGSEGVNGKRAAPPQGAGQSDGGEMTEPPPAAEDKPDEANLDFARKATELSVQKLRNQLDKNQVDQQLLDSLKWTKSDMEHWVSRWEEMFRRSAEKGPKGEAARTELDASLRALGLTPHGTQISGHRRDDSAQGMKEGRRTRPPAEYQEQFRQYTRGVARGQNGNGGAPADSPSGGK